MAISTVDYKYEIDPCPICGAPVSQITMSSDYYPTQYWSGSYVQYVQNVYVPPTVTVGPCGHPVICEQSCVAAGDGTQTIKVKLTSPYAAGQGGYFVPPVYFAGGGYGHPVVAALAQLVPAIATHTADCPECQMHQPLSNIIIHLNDNHRWPRERIADWLDLLDIDLTIQRKEAA